MKFLDRYDAINPLSLSDSVKLIAPFAQGEILRPEHIVYKKLTLKNLLNVTKFVSLKCPLSVVKCLSLQNSLSVLNVLVFKIF